MGKIEYVYTLWGMTRENRWNYRKKEDNEWRKASERCSGAQTVIWNPVSRDTLTRRKVMCVFESVHKKNPAMPGRLQLRVERKSCFPIYLLPFFYMGIEFLVGTCIFSAKDHIYQPPLQLSVTI